MVTRKKDSAVRQIGEYVQGEDGHGDCVELCKASFIDMAWKRLLKKNTNEKKKE